MDRLNHLRVRPVWQFWLALTALEAAAVLARARLVQAPLPRLSATTALGTLAALVIAGVLGWSLHRLLDAALARRAATIVLGDGMVEPVRLTWAWRASALAVVLACLALLEWRQPFYFVQDDNWAQFLPVIVHGGRAVFDGVAPVWNPYIFGGVPSAELGIYALTYPVTYIAYATARLLGNDLLTLDIFALLHLGAAVLVMQELGARLGMRPAIATLAALSFTLCGFNLMVGRSWYYVLPTSLWLPAMLLGLVLLRQQRGVPSPMWLAGTGLSIGLLFHAGNAQFWLYAVSVLWLLALAMAGMREVTVRQLAALLCATILGVAVAAPLLLPQMAALAIDRGGGGCGIQVRSLLDMVLPYPLAGQTPHPCRWPPLLPQGYAGLAYAGTLTTLAAFAGLFALFAYRADRRRWAANLWLPLMLVLLVAAIGHAAKLWTILTWLPVFSRFAHPFKLMLFVELAAALGGGLVLNRLVAAVRPAARSLVEGAALAVGTLALVYAGVASDMPFFRYNATGTPYAALPAPIARVLDQPANGAGERIVGVSAWRDDAESYSVALPHNTADLYGRYTLLGYGDGGFENSLPPVARLLAGPRGEAMLRALGVRWVVVHDDVRHPAWPGTPGPTMMDALAAVRAHGVLRARADGVSLFELPDSAPMAFFHATGGTRIALAGPRVDARGVTVNLPPGHGAGVATINFLALPRMHAYLDGAPAPVVAGAWGLATVRVTPGVRSLELRYEPRWLPGWLVAAIAAVAAVAGFLLLRRRPREITRHSMPTISGKTA